MTTKELAEKLASNFIDDYYLNDKSLKATLGKHIPLELLIEVARAAENYYNCAPEDIEFMSEEEEKQWAKSANDLREALTNLRKAIPKL